MLPDRIEKELKDLDFYKVDFKNGEWNWGRGGHPLADDEFSVSHTSEDMTETRYKLPPFLNEMLTAQYSYGKQDAKAAIRSALGVQ